MSKCILRPALIIGRLPFHTNSLILQTLRPRYSAVSLMVRSRFFRGSRCAIFLFTVTVQLQRANKHWKNKNLQRHTGLVVPWVRVFLIFCQQSFHVYLKSFHFWVGGRRGVAGPLSPPRQHPLQAPGGLFLSRLSIFNPSIPDKTRQNPSLPELVNPTFPYFFSKKPKNVPFM